MPIQDEARIRRQGRMALLIHELDLLPDGYRPPDEELGRAKELLVKLGAAVKKWESRSAPPQPEVDPAAAKKGKGEKD